MNETNTEAIKSLSPETTNGRNIWTGIKRNGKGMAPMPDYLLKFKENFERLVELNSRRLVLKKELLVVEQNIDLVNKQLAECR